MRRRWRVVCRDPRGVFVAEVSRHFTRRGARVAAGRMDSIPRGMMVPHEGRVVPLTNYSVEAVA